MSQIRSAFIAGALMTSLSLSGCGDENSQAVFNSESGGNHPTGWVAKHGTSARANPVGCSECHGDNFDGGISQVSCMSPTTVNGFSCHATNPLESPTACISCHGVAPGGPYGNAAPNREFAHAEHTALPAITEIGCDSCHLNAGPGSLDHAKAAPDGGPRPATVTISNAFRAKTLTTFGYDGTKCSGVSCHGGQDTPTWSTGSISCEQCHELGTAPATPQYNSYFSGIKAGRNLHEQHIQATVACTDCHNIGILNDYQQHYSGIRNNSFTAPRNTVGGLPTKIGTYNGTTQTCGGITDMINCHPGTTWSQP